VDRPADTSPGDRPRPLGGGVEARVWEVATPEGLRVIKVGDARRTAREAEILAQLAGSTVAPRLLAAGVGMLITERLDGAPLRPRSWSLDNAEALGRLLRRVHDLPAPTAGDEYAVADHRYRDARIADIRRGCRPDARSPTESSIATLPPLASDRLVLLHGDPWSGNVVWGADGPVLVDWEYARPGERAEDLAYLAAMDELPTVTLASVLGGYGAGSDLRARVEAWRPLMAAWCGSWLWERGETDRGARLLAHADRLVKARREGG
jgi:Ser/Thr protein kinase RdoA (MazF antagonist)